MLRCVIYVKVFDRFNLRLTPRIKMTSWKLLLLIYSRINVRVRSDGWLPKRFKHALSDDEVQDAIDSFEQFPTLVEEFTAGRAGIEYQIDQIERSLTSLTPMGKGMYWPSPDDTREEIHRIAPPGSYDSLFILWPQQNLQDGPLLRSGGWGLAIAASSWSNIRNGRPSGR